MTRIHLAILLISLAQGPFDRARAELACSNIFRADEVLVTQLALLKARMAEQNDPAVAQLLYAEYQTKILEARAAGVDLSRLGFKIESRARQSERDRSVPNGTEERLRRSRRYKEDRPLIEESPILLPQLKAYDLGIAADRAMVFFQSPRSTNQSTSQTTNQISVWDRFGNSYAPFSIPNREVLSITASPDGQLSAVTFNSDALHAKLETTILRTHSRENVGTWDEAATAFSSDSSLAAMQTGADIKILRTSDFSEVTRLSKRGYVNKMLFSPDKQELFVASTGQRATQIDRIDLSTGASLKSFAIDLYLADFALSSDATRIAVGELTSSKLRIYDTATGRKERELEIDNNATPSGVGFLDHDRLVVAVTSDKRVMVWSAIDWQLKGILPASSKMMPKSISISSDHQTLFVYAYDEPLRVFKVNDSSPY